MATEAIDTLIVGGGQAGLAMSAHLVERGVPHLVLERDRIAESWRSARWDSLVMNGPAWHDRFPPMEFPDVAPDGFPTKDQVSTYLERFAQEMDLPIRCGVDVRSVERQGSQFAVETSEGSIQAQNIVAATGPYQTPSIPPLVPETAGLTQIHSSQYKRPDQLPDGAVLVVGSGSSGAQIAQELLASGRDVYLSIGPHHRPPRRYRGKDYCWWLGVLGKWEAATPPAGAEHVTIAVSGAQGGHTIDFRQFALDGMTLVGMTERYSDGVLTFAPDLQRNIADGDANLQSVFDEADAYIAQHGLDLPPDPDARTKLPDPDCLTQPLRTLNVAEANVTSIIWATGFTQDFRWLKVDTFDALGKPLHTRGVSPVPGLYFLGLPWLTMRGSSFIWGVWVDAGHLATHLANARCETAVS